MQTFLEFPRGLVVDVERVPDNFDELIAKAFTEYTHGTAKAYTYQDKLAFIDKCREYAYNVAQFDTGDEVRGLIKTEFARELDDFGEIPDAEDFLSIGFMEQCYNEGFQKGKCDLYGSFKNDRHVDEKIMQLLYRAIQVVIGWEE